LRADRPSDRWLPDSVALALPVVAAGIGAAAFHAPGAFAGGVGGALLGSALRARLLRRRQRRRNALRLPFPGDWRETLLHHYDHYHRLPDDWRARFEDDLRLFLSEARITGIDVEVTDELRLLVAASAVTLSLGWPAFEWEPLAEVLLYPQDFDRDWTFGKRELSGQAHGWGTVILSVPTLLESFAHPEDAYHVGLHEFAHLLDVEQGRFDGVPLGLTSAQVGHWLALADKEMQRLRRGKSAVDSYGAEEPAEFLAVAVEAFFEIPLVLRQRHQELYAFLSSYFAQDPAAWDEARGLRA
jgi:MtfA peptidase